MSNQDSSDQVRRELAAVERQAAFERLMEFERLVTLLRRIKADRILVVFNKSSTFTTGY